MAYAISCKAPTGKTLKAIVKDLETGLFWDQTNSVWVAAETVACQITMTEGTLKGFYTGSGGLTPIMGGCYEVTVKDASNFQFTTKEVYSSKSKTVLEVLNDVQKELRLPASTDILDSMAKIILAKMNTILMVILPEKKVFDHLKVEGSFKTASGVTHYRLAPINVEAVDRIDQLCDEDGNEISFVNDDAYFKSMALSFSESGTTGSPLYWRISSRDGGFPMIEVLPVPDAAYSLSYTGVKAPKELTTKDDYVMNPLVIKNGALMMVKQELGRDASSDAAVFNTALGRAASTESSAVSGDVEV